MKKVLCILCHVLSIFTHERNFSLRIWAPQVSDMLVRALQKKKHNNNKKTTTTKTIRRRLACDVNVHFLPHTPTMLMTTKTWSKRSHETAVPGDRRCKTKRVSPRTKTPWCSRQRKREPAESLSTRQTSLAASTFGCKQRGRDYHSGTGLCSYRPDYCK